MYVYIYITVFVVSLRAPYYKKKQIIKIDHRVYYSGRGGVLVLGNREYAVRYSQFIVFTESKAMS